MYRIPLALPNRWSRPVSVLPFRSSNCLWPIYLLIHCIFSLKHLVNWLIMGNVRVNFHLCLSHIDSMTTRLIWPTADGDDNDDDDNNNDGNTDVNTDVDVACEELTNLIRFVPRPILYRVVSNWTTWGFFHLRLQVAAAPRTISSKNQDENQTFCQITFLRQKRL